MEALKMDHKSLDFSLKVKITLPDGRRQKFAISFPELKLVRLNQSTTGLDVGAVIEFLPGITVCRPAAGYTMTVKGSASERTPISVGSIVSVGHYEIEFLVLPDPLPEEEATRVISLKADDVANQERTQFVSLRDLNSSEPKNAEPPPASRPETQSGIRPDPRVDARPVQPTPPSRPEVRAGSQTNIPSEPSPQLQVQQQTQPQAQSSLQAQLQAIQQSQQTQQQAFNDEATAIVRRMPLPASARSADDRHRSSRHDTKGERANEEGAEPRAWYQNLRQKPVHLVVGALVLVTVFAIGRSLMHRGAEADSKDAADREIASAENQASESPQAGSSVPSDAQAGAAANPPQDAAGAQANVPYVPPPSGRGVPFQPPPQQAGGQPAAQAQQQPTLSNPPSPSYAAPQGAQAAAPQPPSMNASAQGAPSESIYAANGQFDPMTVDFFFSAIERGDTFKIRELLDSRAVDVNLSLRRGYSPLHVAAARGDTTTVKVLLKYKANPNARDPAGSTPLMWAVYRRHSGVVRLLSPLTDLALEREGGQKALDLAKSINAREYYGLLTPKTKLDRKVASQKDKAGKNAKHPRPSR
jgi:hypothetical protein